MQIQDKQRETKDLVVLAVLCAVLQLAIAPNIGIGNGRANLALVFTACLAFFLGPKSAVAAGFFAGLFFDLSTTGPVGLMALCLTVASYVMGLQGRGSMGSDLMGALAAFVGCDLAVSFAYHLAMLLVGQASSLLDVIVFRTLPTALLSLIAFVPFAYYFARVRSTGPNLGGKGGHFSTKGL